MKRVFGLVLISVTLALAATPTKTKPSSSTSQKGPKSSKPASGSNKTSSHRAVSTVRTNYKRTAKGRQGKTGQTSVAHTHTSSYQQHPDEDRYREIQQSLTEKGYFKGEVNGKWDADSVDALKRFQTDRKFPDIYTDGKINSLSLIGLGLGPKHGSTPASTPSAAPTAMSPVSQAPPPPPIIIPASQLPASPSAAAPPRQ
jgi:putative peptidoglycan binding protein